MLTLRHLLLFGFLALLTGCAAPCAAPDALSDRPARSCFYQLKVTNINMSNYHVTATLPETVYKKSNKEKRYTRKDHENFGKEFTFRVTDLDKVGGQMQVGKTYEFIRQGNAAYLELLTGGPIQ